jgi:hypothetical protein
MRDLIAGMDSSAIMVLGGPDLLEYISGDGDRVSVSGIFDAYYQNPAEGEMGAVMYTPALFTTLAQLSSDPALDPSAVVVVDGTEYTVREPKRDGQGGVLLLLHLVTP